MAGNAEKKRQFPWLKVVLGISLALNLAVVGFVGGALWRHAGSEQHRAQQDRGVVPYVMALPRKERWQVFSALRSGEGDRDSARAAGRADRMAVLAALRAEPFDEAALLAAMQGQRQRMEQMVDRAQAVWLDTVSRMTPQARRDYAERLENGRHKRFGEGWGHSDRP